MKVKSLKKRDVLFSIKNCLKNCEDYSPFEEYLLVEYALKLTKEELFLKEEFLTSQIKKIKNVLKKRLNGKPLNKIFKKQNFYGFEFYINDFVLAPRKETELLVEKFLQAHNESENILDLCCGSGCIGLTIAKILKDDTKITLIDIDKHALSVAKKNKKLLNITRKVKFVLSDLFSGLKKNCKFDTIICNPPYIKSEDCKKLSVGVKNFDPIISLNGGKDGLDFYRRIALECKNYLTKNGKVFLEIGYDQGMSVQDIFTKNGFVTKCFKDYSNCDRIIVAKRNDL